MFAFLFVGVLQSLTGPSETVERRGGQTEQNRFNPSQVRLKPAPLWLGEHVFYQDLLTNFHRPSIHRFSQVVDGNAET